MSAEALDPELPARPEGWPGEFDAALWARACERVKHLPPLTDEQVRRIAPLVNAVIGSPRTTRTAS